jgi:hypothetical protein
MTQKTYDRLLELGLRLAQQGWPVILDAKYDRFQLREPVLMAATAAQLPVQIVQCLAPIEVLHDRLQSRTGDITDATVDLLEAQLQTAEPLSATELAMTTVLNTNQPLAPQLEALITRLSSRANSSP